MTGPVDRNPTAHAGLTPELFSRHLNDRSTLEYYESQLKVKVKRAVLHKAFPNADPALLDSLLTKT